MMIGRWTGWAAGSAAALLIVTTAAGAGRQGTPDATPLVVLDRPLDLAAMALDAGDLPDDGVARVPEEFYLDLAGIDGVVDPVRPRRSARGDRLPPNVRQLLLADGRWDAGSLLDVEEYASPEGAAAGFDLFEDEARWLPATPGSTWRTVRCPASARRRVR